MSKNNLIIAAENLSKVIENLDRSLPLLDRAYVILRPLVDDALAGRIASPGQLPNHSFFYGMYEDSLPAHYLTKVELLGAITEFDEAWKNYEA